MLYLQERSSVSRFRQHRSSHRDCRHCSLQQRTSLLCESTTLPCLSVQSDKTHSLVVSHCSHYTLTVLSLTHLCVAPHEVSLTIRVHDLAISSLQTHQIFKIVSIPVSNIQLTTIAPCCSSR